MQTTPPGRKSATASLKNAAAALQRFCPAFRKSLSTRRTARFYLSVVFKKELSNRMKMRIDNAAVKDYMEGICTPAIEPDRKFVYHLLASRNICVVPLTSFVCSLQGFRCTLLERDDARFEEIYHGVREGILEFLGSV
jgi:alanine-synthesizing transaminase